MTTWQCAGCLSFIVSFSSLFICMDTTLLLWFTRSALIALFNDQTMTIMICNHTVCWGHFSTWPLSNRSVVIYVILHLEQLFEIYGWLFFYAHSPAAKNCQKRNSIKKKKTWQHSDFLHLMMQVWRLKLWCCLSASGCSVKNILWDQEITSLIRFIIHGWSVVTVKR